MSVEINKYLKVEEPRSKTYTVIIKVVDGLDWWPTALTRVETVKLIKCLLHHTGQHRLTMLVR